MVDVEPLDGLLAADDLLVAVAPAEAQQIVEQRLVQQTEFVAIGVDAQRAVALRELGAVRAVDQRHVGIDGYVPSPCRG
jgi:hypothetical protein